MDFAPLYNAIDELLSQHDHVVVAIDGPCASGKSTLATEVGNRYSAPVIRVDDFFLPPHLRTEERLAQVGGNVDSERFLQEVLNPLSAGKPLIYRPWRCKVGDFGEEIAISPAPLTIIEGAYSLRPDFRPHYHLRVFLTAPLSVRYDRLRCRNGEDGLLTFQNRWIPLENSYFEGCNVEKCCQIVLSY